MTPLRRPATRFVLWAVLIAGVAAGAGVAGWSPWVIIGLVFGVWVIVAACERKLSGPGTTRAAAAHNPAARTGELDDLLRADARHKAELARPVEPERPAVAPTRDVPPTEPVPLAVPRRRGSLRARPAAAVVAGTEWNIWTLEEVARENAPDNDELVYLTVSLRDFADANGLLPAGFDPLVRESFGSLLPTPG